MIHVSKDNPGKLIVISNSIKSISFSSKKDVLCGSCNHISIAIWYN